MAFNMGSINIALTSCWQLASSRWPILPGEGRFFLNKVKNKSQLVTSIRANRQ